MFPDQSQTLGISMAAFTLLVIILAIAFAVLSVVIYWRIFAKAGYNGALGLLMFVPIVNFIVLCLLAFGEWPIYRELDELRRREELPSGNSI
jgi:uncharacterized membrane protein